MQIAAGPGSPAVSAWADPAALGRRRRERGAGRHRTTLLSPFDSLVWDRKRTLRVFGFEHSLEAYVPQAKRVHGYFTMPLLAGGKLVGRVDPAREGSTLIARKLTIDKPAAAEPMAQALVEAASWVGCQQVRLEQVEPPALAPRLRAALASTAPDGSSQRPDRASGLGSIRAPPAGRYSSPENRSQADCRVMPSAAPILVQVMPRLRA